MNIVENILGKEGIEKQPKYPPGSIYTAHHDDNCANCGKQGKPGDEFCSLKCQRIFYAK